MKKYIIALLLVSGVFTSRAALAGNANMANGQTETVIGRMLSVNQPDMSVLVISVRTSPTALGYVVTFEARTVETGVTGIAQQFMVRGLYNLANEKLTVLERHLDESAKAATNTDSVKAALKKLLESDQADHLVSVESLDVAPTYMGFLFSFKAEVVEIGLTGIAIRHTVTGFYNTVTNTMTKN
ncbi:MAG: hypothetical protein WCK76_05070 [Elusimicrobiota bacterium]